MVLGAIWCDKEEVKGFTDKVKMLKDKHGMPRKWEIKWTKVSGAKRDYYLDLIRLFFSEEGLNFRAIVIPTEGLDHDLFHQTADEFYYKMQYTMLKNVVAKNVADFRIYLDYKDAWSASRSKKLAEYLSNTQELAASNFTCQPIRSYESVLIQLSDLLIGAIASANNDVLSKVTTKQEIVQLLEELSGQKMTQQTPYGVDKFNIFKWHDFSEGK